MSGVSDAFLAKVNPSGAALVYSTFLGGSGDERGFGVAVDGAGEATVVGWTTSADFPVTPGVFQPRIGTTLAGVSNAFIARFDANGTALRWSTYLGGGWCAGSGQSSCFGIFGSDEGIDVATSVATDAAGFTYVGGYATSTLFPLVDRLQAFGPGGDVQRVPFVARIRPGGASLAYSVVLGSRTAASIINQIAIDGRGGVVAAGSAYDAFPLTAGATFGAGQGFVFKLAPGNYPTTLRSSVDPAQRGQTILLLADSDSGANGTMTFRDGATVLGTAPVQNGVASLDVTLAPGVHRLTATHSADGKPSRAGLPARGRPMSAASKHRGLVCACAAMLLLAQVLCCDAHAAGNKVPTAAITAPKPGATFAAPATIAIAATATDADGTVARVDFYLGTTLLGSRTAAPYAADGNQRARRHLRAHGDRHRQLGRDEDVLCGGRHGHGHASVDF